MKIALYEVNATVKLGGIETFNRELARELAARGHTVHLFGGTATVLPPLAGVEIRTYKFISRERIPNFGSRFRKFGERISFAKNSFRDLVAGHYDYIYVSKPYDLPAALLARSRSGARVIFGSGGTEFFPGYHWMVRQLDYFFACSEFNASQIEEYCGIRPRVLPNGVNTQLFSPQGPSAAGMRENVGIEEDDIVIVSACRLVGWKGIQFAIRAVARLIEQHYPIKYFIMGAGEYRSTLEQLVDSLGVSEQVVFLGPVSNAELPAWYSIADVAVFPSVADETFGIAIAEAMACGVPVVSTKVGGIPEVVPPQAGILVNPKDDVAIAEAIARLADDPEFRRTLGRAGSVFVRQSFSWDRIASKLEEYLTGK